MRSAEVLALLIVCLLSIATIHSVPVGSPYSTAPAPFPSQNNGLQSPNGALFGDMNRKPYPTNEWWVNLVLGRGESPIKTYPYLLQAAGDGLRIAMPTRTVAQAFIFETFLENISFRARETLTNKKVTKYSKMAVTLRYQSTADASASMELPIVRGMAYVTAVYNNLSPLLNTIHAISSVNGDGAPGGKTFTGTKFVLQYNNGQRWIVYASNSISFNVAGSQLQATGRYTGYLRVVNSDTSAEAVYDQYRSAYPVDGIVVHDVQYTNNKYDAATNTERFDIGTITFQFSKVGSSQLLMFALPHHIDSMDSSTLRYTSPRVQAQTIKGRATLLVGDTWILKEQLTNIGFYSKYLIPAGERENIRAALRADQGQTPAAQDPYFGGKQVAKLGRLALIADELGETQIATNIRNNMKNYLNNFLDNKFVFDTTWSGVVSRTSLTGAGADFGGGLYNDHHFHYGYFLYAAACVAKADAGWLNQYKEKVLALARDYANPSSADTLFPVLRNKDPYCGHSFAAGLYEFADSRNQESTSEAINAYYGLYLFGAVIGNSNMRDFGRILLATEIRSTKTYWHIKSDNQIYDAAFKAGKVVGVLWETKVDYATFFGNNVEFIHMIQALPFTPITEEYLPRDWIQEEYPVVSSAFTRANPPLDDGWRGFIYMAHSIIDKAAARGEINRLNGFDDGNTRTNTIYFVTTRPGGDTTMRNPSQNGLSDTGSTPATPTPVPTIPIPPNPQPTTPTPQPTTPTPQPTTPNPNPNPPTCTCPNPPTPVPTNPNPNPPTENPSQGNCGTGLYECNDQQLGKVCYSPTTHVCANNNRLCGVGSGACGLQCFATSMYKCCPGNVLKQKSENC